MSKPARKLDLSMTPQSVHPLLTPADLPVSQTRSLREIGKNEAWLQKRIFDTPSILGLGDLQSVYREKAQASRGRLDILLTDPVTDAMFEVEVMLGETDESHIVRTIEYWDMEKRLRPNRKHTAVLVAERINSRFYNVIHLLGRNIPIVGIQCNAVEIDGKTGLHFTRIIDSYIEPEIDLVEESTPQDENRWTEQSANQVALARKLEALAKDQLEEVELRFLPQYMAIKAGRYDRIKMWTRKNGRTLISYRLEGDHFEEAVAACEAARIEPTQKTDTCEIQFASDLKRFSETVDLHRNLLRWINRRDLQFKPTPQEVGTR